VLAVALAVAATLLLSGGEAAAPTGSPPTPAPATPGPASSPAAPVVLTGTRVVQARAGVVTIVDSVTVTDGEAVSVGPARRSRDPALVLTGVQLLAEDGTATTFRDPVSLGADRTLTVRGTYRLRACPDLLPVSWPSPMAVSGPEWSRTWTRTSEPLRTAQTLCPRARSRAPELPGLRARLVGGDPPGDPPEVQVRLRWRGSGSLVVTGIGSAGGLAAAAPAAGEGGARLLTVPARASAALRLQPVESCPNARPRGDRLTLLTDPRTRRGPGRLVAVTVPGLGRWLDRHVCG
jgi:hypothetical protein